MEKVGEMNEMRERGNERDREKEGLKMRMRGVFENRREERESESERRT